MSEHFCSVGSWEDKALIYELCPEFTLSVSRWKRFICAHKTCDMIWCLKLVNALPVIKYPNIFNVLMVQGDGVACGYALHTRLVRVR